MCSDLLSLSGEIILLLAHHTHAHPYNRHTPTCKPIHSFTFFLNGNDAEIQRRQRGKQAGMLVKLKQQGLGSALPSTHLANVCCLARWTNCCFSTEQIWTFTDLLCYASLKPGLVSTSWLAHSIYQASNSYGRTTQSYWGKRGVAESVSTLMKVGITGVTVLTKSCNPHFETLFINCKPFHSPQVFLIHSGWCLHPSVSVRHYNTWLTR